MGLEGIHGFKEKCPFYAYFEDFMHGFNIQYIICSNPYLYIFYKAQSLKKLDSILMDRTLVDKKRRIMGSPHSIRGLEHMSFMSFFYDLDFRKGQVPKIVLKIVSNSKVQDGLRHSVTDSLHFINILIMRKVLILHYIPMHLYLRYAMRPMSPCYVKMVPLGCDTLSPMSPWTVGKFP